MRGLIQETVLVRYNVRRAAASPERKGDRLQMVLRRTLSLCLELLLEVLHDLVAEQDLAVIVQQHQRRHPRDIRWQQNVVSIVQHHVHLAIRPHRALVHTHKVGFTLHRRRLRQLLQLPVARGAKLAVVIHRVHDHRDTNNNNNKKNFKAVFVTVRIKKKLPQWNEETKKGSSEEAPRFTGAHNLSARILVSTLPTQEKVKVKEAKADMATLEKVHTGVTQLTFTLRGVDVSFANAIRRTVLSRIPVVVLRTHPHAADRSVIHANTTIYHNELLKHRLSCIPVHAHPHQFPVDQYVVEVLVENEGDVPRMVTTEDFVVKHKHSREVVRPSELRQLFPPNPLTGQYIDFVRLRPLRGERIFLVCDFDIGNQMDDGCFNAACTCSYGMTPDKEAQARAREAILEKWRAQERTESEIEWELSNWEKLEAKRFVRPQSFDFVVETASVYSNAELLVAACNILRQQCEELISNDSAVAIHPIATQDKGFDLHLEGHDATMSGILTYLWCELFLDKRIVFCAAKKRHPHDTFVVMRVLYHPRLETVEEVHVREDLRESLRAAIATIDQLQTVFQTIRG